LGEIIFFCLKTFSKSCCLLLIWHFCHTAFLFVGIISNLSSDLEDFWSFYNLFLSLVFVWDVHKKKGAKKSPNITQLFVHNKTTFFTKDLFSLIPSHFPFLMLNEQNLSVFVVCLRGLGLGGGVGKASLSLHKLVGRHSCVNFFVHAPCFIQEHVLHLPQEYFINV
jgi:hypothetical protein